MVFEGKLRIFVLITIVLVAGYLAIKYLFGYFMPFIIALVLAALIDPLVQFGEKKLKLGRGLAVFLVLSVFLLLITLVIFLGLSRVYIELSRLKDNLPDYQVIGSKIYFNLTNSEQIKEWLDSWEKLSKQPFFASLNSNLQSLYEQLQQGLVGVVTQILKSVNRLPGLLTILLISLVATFFISRDKELILNFVLKFFPLEWRRRILEVKDEIYSAGIGFVRAELILISITTVISMVGLTILGSEYGIILGLTAGLLDLIPIIGPGLIYIPWTLYSFITGNVSFGFGLLVVYTIMAGVRQVTEAKIVGESIGIHPLATLISMYIGLKLFGIAGFIIGPGVVIIGKALYKTGLITIILGNK